MARVLEELRAQLALWPNLNALTLWRPWDWAIFRAGKPVENRGWSMPSRYVGQWIALHGGKKYDRDGAAWIADTFNVLPPEDTGAPGAIKGLVKFGESFRSRGKPDSWEVGPWCWPVTAKLELPSFIERRGAQGLWVVPPSAVEQILAQLAEASRG